MPSTVDSSDVADKYDIERLLRALNKAHIELRIYAVTLLAASLFFFGWSILSFFFTIPYLSFFGTVIFAASIGTSSFLLTDYAASTGWCTRLNYIFSQVCNAVYFFASALTSRNLSYGTEWTIAAAALFVITLFGCFIGMFLLVRVQRLTLKYMTVEIVDTESEDDPISVQEGAFLRQISSSSSEEEILDSFDTSSAGSTVIEVENVHSMGSNDEFEVEYRG